MGKIKEALDKYDEAHSSIANVGETPKDVIDIKKKKKKKDDTEEYTDIP